MSAINKTLMLDARTALRETMVARGTKDKIIDLMGEYETAIHLSNGPDPKRAVHWSLKAATAARSLRDVVDRATGR